MLTSGSRSLDQEVVLRVGRLPALVVPESRLARSVALRRQALLAHIGGDRLYLCVELFHANSQLLQMQMAFIVHHLSLAEHACHIALQLVVLVNFFVAKLLDGLCEVMNTHSSSCRYFTLPMVSTTFSDTLFLHTDVMNGLQKFHQLRRRPLDHGQKFDMWE